MTRSLIFLLGIFIFPSLMCFAQWNQTNGPYGASVNAFGATPSKLFAGTGGGIFSSTNNGTSWSPSYTATGLYGIAAIASSATTVIAGGAADVVAYISDVSLLEELDD